MVADATVATGTVPTAPEPTAVLASPDAAVGKGADALAAVAGFAAPVACGPVPDACPELAVKLGTAEASGDECKLWMADETAWAAVTGQTVWEC